jgi:hypothetical protein
MRSQLNGISQPVESAVNILSNSLKLRRDNQVILVFDSFGQDVANAFIEACRILNQNLFPVFVPFSVQADGRNSRAIKALKSRISSSGALITCLTDTDESTDFRGGLVDVAVKALVQCVHMPGVNEEIFVQSTQNLDVKKLDRRARKLAECLTKADRIDIQTFSYQTNSNHTLSLRVDGRAGHADGGIARPGHVINWPTGEAYVAPLENSASGSIVINGSFPQCDLSRDCEVLLFISNGAPELEKSKISLCGAGEYCRDLLEDAHSASAKYFQVGELGLGLNPCVSSASGRTIVDEKAFGSAHIALGRNTTFGGRNRAPYHHDLVFYPSAVYIDQKLLQAEWHVPERKLWDE